MYRHLLNAAWASSPDFFEPSSTLDSDAKQLDDAVLDHYHAALKAVLLLRSFEEVEALARDLKIRLSAVEVVRNTFFRVLLDLTRLGHSSTESRSLRWEYEAFAVLGLLSIGERIRFFRHADLSAPLSALWQQENLEQICECAIFAEKLSFLWNTLLADSEIFSKTFEFGAEIGSSSRARGGNQYQIQLFKRGSNPHAVWDSGLVKTVSDDPDVWAGLLKTKRVTGKAEVIDPVLIAQKSC